MDHISVWTNEIRNSPEIEKLLLVSEDRLPRKVCSASSHTIKAMWRASLRCSQLGHLSIGFIAVHSHFRAS